MIPISSGNIANKLNANPYETRGEEILTRYEDDYKFHRYTNRYGNAFGSEFYTIRITCRSILTDPEIHQKLHDTHNEKHSSYYVYWYGIDVYTRGHRLCGYISDKFLNSWQLFPICITI